MSNTDEAEVDEQTAEETTEATRPQLNGDDTEQTEEEPEQFPLAYVQKLRQENAEQRTRAKDRDGLAAALWHARVEASGKLADPTDLPLPTDTDPTDPEAVTVAVDELLQRKPHLASRKVTGDVGQGQAGGAATVDLAGLLRSRAS